MKTNQKQKNIPKGWKSKKFNEVLEVVTDYVSNGSFASLKENVTYLSEKSHAVLIRLKDYNNKFDVENFIYINEHAYNFLSKSKVFRGDVILSNVGSVGSVFRAPDLDINMSLAPNSILVKTNQDNHKDYFFYLLVSERGQYLLRNITSTTAQPKFNKTDFKDINFMFPSLPEQNRIVAVLETWDAGIEKLKQKIEIKKRIKKGLMQQLLTGKERLPGFSDDWNEVKLEYVIQKFSTGLNPRKNFKLGSGDNYYVTIKNINDGKLDFSKAEFINDSALSQINKRSNLSNGDLIMSSIGNVGEAYLLKEDPYKWDINESVFSLKPDQDKLIPGYLYYLITSENTKRYFKNNITGSSFKSIKMKDLKVMKFLLPNHDEQKAIAQVLTAADDEITVLEKKLSAWQHQKKYLLNNLVTGQIRTPEDLVIN